MPPFLAIKGYLPKSGLKHLTPITGNAIQRREMKNADRFIQHQEKLREFLRNELIWARAKQEDQANKRRHAASELRVGNKVMLDSRYISTIRPNRGLDYKNLGSFEIIRAINNSVYELDLPKSMKEVFPVFHL